MFGGRKKGWCGSQGTPEEGQMKMLESRKLQSRMGIWWSHEGMLDRDRRVGKTPAPRTSKV